MSLSRRRFLITSPSWIAAAPACASGMTVQQFDATAALAAINKVRAEHRRDPLVANHVLAAIAREQAEHLRRIEVMTHSPEGQGLRDRAKRAGYPRLVAENLADGYITFDEAIAAWLASPDHRTTLLGYRYHYFGAAVAVSPHAIIGETGTFWVTEFGV